MALPSFGVGRMPPNWVILEIATRAVTERKEKNVVYTHALSKWKFEIEGKVERRPNVGIQILRDGLSGQAATPRCHSWFVEGISN